MDILEASAKLERIELLAKIAHVCDVNAKEKTIALEWIGEIAEELREITRGKKSSPCSESDSRSRCRFQ
ncbi:TPA: hypothetical protein ME748_004125 [Klebsiella aerogenes]|nr:hypothetical protein [Klebsiella aerogenes]SAX15477.1 Uncharacterised protein [Klebsiella pneumoniae]HBW5539792.1 hypothetical protein [Klebsiella aerogenes]